ncbi:MAG: FAD-dependent oxidoreductase [Acidobacteriota bacterium]
MDSPIKSIDDPPSSEESPLLELSAASAAALEFPAMLRVLASLASTDVGHADVADLRPLQCKTELLRRRRKFEEARRLAAASPLVPASERPFQPVLAAISDPNTSILGRDLVLLADLLSASTTSVERVLQADPPCETLAESARELTPAEHLFQKLRSTFDARGEIRENATPRLAQLRSRIRSARTHIYDQLSSLIDEHREHLSEETIPMRGGRLVLMLNSGARGRVSGLVHGRSGSGRSFYFEPIAAVDGNNQLQQAVEDEEAEKRRILREILALLRSEANTLQEHAAWIAELDLLQAAHRFAELTGARLADLGERHELTLLGARHPLLDPRLVQLRRDALGTEGHRGDVVPLDVTLSRSQRALVVTGPNAGGKTVALKTVGLLVTLHHCGLPIPAAVGSRLPLLDGLVATVGDDQDLLADRSTFSGRLLRLREAWDVASPDALMLLDELGSGTDPEEGAALSQALLEGLVERKALVLVTTHLSQVAATALDTDGAFCAAMEFDPANGEPTYRLVPGPPGGSDANLAGGNFAVRKRHDGGYTIAHSRYSVADIVPDSVRLFGAFVPALKADWRDLKFQIGKRFWDEFTMPRQWAMEDESPMERTRINQPQPSLSILSEALDELRTVLPQFKSARIVEEWAGLIDVMPDAVPVISAVDTLPGFYIASGFSGHGFGLGPGAGKLMAEIVRGVDPCVDATAFRHDRFI